MSHLKILMTLKMKIMEITKMDYDMMSTGEKIQFLYDKLNRIKPGCFKDYKESNKPMGDFWVNLKDAEGYDWNTYDCEDFLVTFSTSNPNNSSYSADADSYTVAYPHDFYEGAPNQGKHWLCGNHVDRPNWFTTHNINEGAIWVKPIIIHPVKDEEDDE